MGIGISKRHCVTKADSSLRQNRNSYDLIISSFKDCLKLSSQKNLSREAREFLYEEISKNLRSLKNLLSRLNRFYPTKKVQKAKKALSELTIEKKKNGVYVNQTKVDLLLMALEEVFKPSKC